VRADGGGGGLGGLYLNCAPAAVRSFSCLQESLCVFFLRRGKTAKC
jgi:hypothetical protein